MFRDLEDGIDKIINEDREAQEHFIGVLIRSRIESSNVGKELTSNQEDYLKLVVDYLISIGAFFVPNNDYMCSFFGNAVIDPSVDCYNWEGECNWLGKLVFPIRGAMGNLEGFTGYDPLNKTVREDNRINGTDDIVPFKYTISSSKVFDRSTHLFVPNGYRKMLEDDYLIVVDGVFDAIDIAALGFNSACNLGSYINEKTLFPMSLVSRLLVANDNDEAGIALLNKIRKVIRKAETISQAKTKDMDEFFHIYGTDVFKSKLLEALNSKPLVSITL